MSSITSILEPLRTGRTHFRDNFLVERGFKKIDENYAFYEILIFKINVWSSLTQKFTTPDSITVTHYTNLETKFCLLSNFSNFVFYPI